MSTPKELFDACCAGDIAAVRRAVTNGADPNQVFDESITNGWTKSLPWVSIGREVITPIHVACR